MIIIKKITFAGAYGINSIGDEAGAFFIANSLREIYNEKIFFSILDRHANLKQYEQYAFKSVQNLEYNSKEESIGKWFRGFNYGDDKGVLINIVKEIKNSDLLIIGLGNLLLDITIDLFRGPIPYYEVLSRIATLHEVPIMLYGLSIGPLSTEYGKLLTKSILKQATIKTVRDKKSLALIKKLGINNSDVHLLPDPVVGIKANKIDKSIKRKYIGVSVRSLAYKGDEELNKRYEKSILKIVQYFLGYLDFEVVFIPHCTYEFGGDEQNDIIISKRILEQLTNKDRASVLSKEKARSIPDVLNVYSKCAFSISTRLHSNIFAAITSTPMISINYNPKVKGFIEWLGLQDYCLELNDVDYSNLKEKVENLIGKIDIEREIIKNKILEGKEETDEYINLVVDILEGATNI
ncbi:hypothetical protein GM661_02610 [Iocasia frigidifontis]|uniref:Polysaccharide pyruvyl transferase domain-containing protein n=1 Tax=Iocasia fonsfrigidae TaxID=2682810 RepID=A0A8A7KFK9_9FIRM|nr:polysaccharide pyruvyl transferase family protein [Iocasia fonsfrigidae]QTL96944.1 hypothetical protein GM661_02610 [Iocasia fonsfrigidae]